jgi:hypothetical protein
MAELMERMKLLECTRLDTDSIGAESNIREENMIEYRTAPSEKQDCHRSQGR